MFSNGLYYVDLANAHSLDRVKQILRKEKVEYQNEDTLIVMDHIDNICNKQGSSFRWWVIDLVDKFKTKICLISRGKIDESLYRNDGAQITSLKLGQLNEFESADLLIALTKRQITLNELDCLCQMSVHEVLQQDNRLLACNGVPYYI